MSSKELLEESNKLLSSNWSEEEISLIKTTFQNYLHTFILVKSPLIKYGLKQRQKV